MSSFYARGILAPGCTGTLTIDTTLLNCPAWDIPDLTPLWIETEVDGEDLPLPGQDGAVPYQRRLTVMQFALPMLISGDVAPDGTPYANAWIGLEENTSLLRAGILVPTHTGDGTLPAELVMPSGATREADVHVLGLRTSGSVGAAANHALMRAVLQLSIPAGGFADSGS